LVLVSAIRGFQGDRLGLGVIFAPLAPLSFCLTMLLSMFGILTSSTLPFRGLPTTD
jgi:hypothetical protein